jgi:hypothetical protein
MRRITTAITHRLAASAIRGSWAILRTGERIQSLGAHMEAKAERLADRWGCADGVLAAISETTRS